VSEKPVKPTIVIFDLDSTITKKDTYVAFLLSILKTYPLRLLRCGFLPFAILIHKAGIKDNSWLKETFLSAIASGLTQSQLSASSDQFIEKLKKKGIRSKAIQKIQQHRDANHKLVLASASFDFYVKNLGHQLGFEVIVCTQPSWNKHNKLTGKINGQNCYGKYKLKRLIEILGIDKNDITTIAYTDHHSDAPLLEWVDRAIAVNPTKKLHQMALKKKYMIADWND
jgi:HAD superfamily hydrolase (TIGR01490 family)